MFDRSWYNRAGVERVMGFCTPEQYLEFMREAPEFERMLVHSGLQLTKFWFSVTPSEQRTRFVIRQVDPVRQWKLSPMDIQSLDKWDDYTEAKEAMFFYTDTADAPWTVVKSNDKKRARLEAIRHILEQFDYDGKDDEVVGKPDRKIIGPSALLSEQTSVHVVHESCEEHWARRHDTRRHTDNRDHIGGGTPRGSRRLPEPSGPRRRYRPFCTRWRLSGFRLSPFCVISTSGRAGELRRLP